MFTLNRQVLVSGSILGALLVALGASLAGGQNAPAVRLAVVDMQVVLEAYGQRNTAVSNLEQQMRALQEEVETTAARMERERDSLLAREFGSEAERMRARSAFEQQIADQRIDFERRQRILENQRDSLMRQVVLDVEALVSRVSAENNFDLVLNKRSSAVVWANPGTDITESVRQAIPAS